VITFSNLAAEHSAIRNELDTAISRVVDSGEYVLGSPVTEFENSFANYCGVHHAVGVSSGTSALHLALIAAGVQSGDEVITVSMTFTATVAAVVYTGAIPVMVDVDPTSWTMDPSLVENAITPRTKAIVPVHLHGLMVDMKAIKSIADTHGLKVVEDAAQAHGAQRDGRNVGALGDAAAFSFYPGKNLGALGEGGAVITNSPEIADSVRLLRNWGAKEKNNPDRIGFNYRMDAIQGAVLGVKLAHLEKWLERRRQVARLYDSALGALDLGTPTEAPGSRHTYHVYAVRVAQRDKRISAFDAQSIQYGIHYPVPVHLQLPYRGWGRGEGSLPVTERLAKEFLSLPIHSGLSQRDVELVAMALDDGGR
jgi:dTDP-4-amino-4,6-dideoxygalactose transaminase